MSLSTASLVWFCYLDFGPGLEKSIIYLQGTTQGSSGKLSPKICGENAGSHIYIDAGEMLTSEASLSAVLTQSATWKIKVRPTTSLV